MQFVCLSTFPYFYRLLILSTTLKTLCTCCDYLQKPGVCMVFGVASLAVRCLVLWGSSSTCSCGTAGTRSSRTSSPGRTGAPTWTRALRRCSGSPPRTRHACAHSLVRHRRIAGDGRNTTRHQCLVRPMVCTVWASNDVVEVVKYCRGGSVLFVGHIGIFETFPEAHHRK